MGAINSSRESGSQDANRETGTWRIAAQHPPKKKKYKRNNKNNLFLRKLFFHDLLFFFLKKLHKGLNLGFPHPAWGGCKQGSPRGCRAPSTTRCALFRSPTTACTIQLNTQHPPPPPWGPKPPGEPKRDLPGSEAGEDAQAPPALPSPALSSPTLKGPNLPIPSHSQAVILGTIEKKRAVFALGEHPLWAFSCCQGGRALGLREEVISRAKLCMLKRYPRGGKGENVFN